jgi:hypothetical protein
MNYTISVGAAPITMTVTAAQGPDSGGGGGAATWGTITGTLSSQTDLQNVLNTKQASLTNYSEIVDLTDYPTTFPPTIGSGANQAVAGNDARVVNAVQSVVTGITGADAITNIVSLTEAEYTAATKNASTLYVVTPNP